MLLFYTSQVINHLTDREQDAWKEHTCVITTVNNHRDIIKKICTLEMNKYSFEKDSLDTIKGHTEVLVTRIFHIPICYYLTVQSRPFPASRNKPLDFFLHAPMISVAIGQGCPLSLQRTLRYQRFICCFARLMITVQNNQFAGKSSGFRKSNPNGSHWFPAPVT